MIREPGSAKIAMTVSPSASCDASSGGENDASVPSFGNA